MQKAALKKTISAALLYQNNRKEMALMKIKRNIYIMYGVALLQGMVFYGPIATLYRQAAGVSVLQITVIESISMLLCLLLELPWGIIADKIGYKRTFLFCCTLYFLSKVVFWQADGFGGFLLERIMLSVVIAGLSGVDTSILYLSCGGETSQRVFGVFNSLNTVGLITVSAVYSLLIKDNYRLAGLLTVVSYGMAALLALFLQEVNPPKGELKAPAGEFKSILRGTLGNRHLLMFLVAVALFNESHQTITVFLNQLQYVKCGLTNTQIGYIYMAVTVLGLLGGCSARLTKRFGTLTFALMLYGGAIAACLALAFTTGAVLSVAAIMLLRLVFSLLQPLQTELQNLQVASNNRATALSVNAVLIDSVGVATNIIFGRLAESNIAYAMLLGAGFCTVGLFLFARWHRWYAAG